MIRWVTSTGLPTQETYATTKRRHIQGGNSLAPSRCAFTPKKGSLHFLEDVVWSFRS